MFWSSDVFFTWEKWFLAMTFAHGNTVPYLQTNHCTKQRLGQNCCYHQLAYVTLSNQTHNMNPSGDTKELDIYRDSALRYCGYANEVGESFRPLVPKVFVHLSYAVAVMYVLAECGDKSRKIYKKPEILGGGMKPAAKMAGDVFLWQMLASVAIPGFIINRITYGCGKLIKMSKLKGMPRKWGATIVGLSSIPLIIRPIDHGVDILMDKTYRKYVV